MKLIDFVILSVIMLLVILAIYYVYRNRGNGCQGQCAGCAKAKSCSSWTEEYRNDRDKGK